MLSDQTQIPQAPRESDDKPKKLRVETVHGGIVVEEISNPEPMNNPNCEHEWEIDPTEEEFIAYRCKKPDCGMIALYDK